MISMIFLIIASICNAIMDTLSHHYSTSVFGKFNPKFWNPEISWKNKYIEGNPLLGRKKWILGFNYPVQVSDAWHLSKTIMIGAICLCIIIYEPIITPIIDLFILGTVWNLTFSLLYNRLLKR